MAKNNFNPRSKFERWVREFGGTRKLANALGVTQPAVQHWLNGFCNPGINKAHKILELSKGKLTLADILKARG